MRMRASGAATGVAPSVWRSSMAVDAPPSGALGRDHAPFVRLVHTVAFPRLVGAGGGAGARGAVLGDVAGRRGQHARRPQRDRKSTRNSSHVKNSYAVFCLK